MSKVGDAKKKASGYLSAIRTMLDNYPQPQIPEDMNKLLSANTPFAFVLELLRICGCTPDRLLAWVSEILCGQNVIKAGGEGKRQDARQKKEKEQKSNLHYNEGYGVLDGFEEVIKALLLANIKNMFTCSLNPFIPNDVMKDPVGKKMNGFVGNGIKIPIKTIDLYNVLSHSPNEKNKKGNSCALYFDVEEYSPNEMWKSTDFNAFLWYTINRGTNTDDGEKKMIWDNRCRRWKKLRESRSGNKKFFNNFFDIRFGNKSFISVKNENQIIGKGEYPNRPTDKNDRKTKRKSDENIKKHQYFIVNYSEKGGNSTGVDDYLTIWLNADRYVIETDSLPKITYNKTVFEFNYDFIQNIRLFDSRVILSNVINALYGITNSAIGSVLGGKYSLDERALRGSIGKIVKETINSETTISECSFSFSNDDYDELLNKTQEVVFNQEDINNIVTSVNDINNSSSMEEAKTKINNVLTQVASFELAKNDEEDAVSDVFSFGQNIIIKIIEECIIQIVLQVLGPKVMLVFAVNAYFMGDITDVDDFEPKSFLVGMHNLIFTMVRQLYEMILKQLIQFLIDEIRPLIILMIEKLLLERVRFYIDLLKRLLGLIRMFYNAFKGKQQTKSVIDNVNYADIASEQKEPEEETC